MLFPIHQTTNLIPIQVQIGEGEIPYHKKIVWDIPIRWPILFLECGGRKE